MPEMRFWLTIPGVFLMRPKKQNPSDSDGLFRNRLNNILDRRHGLFAKLTAVGLTIHWAIFTAPLPELSTGLIIRRALNPTVFRLRLDCRVWYGACIYDP